MTEKQNYTLHCELEEKVVELVKTFGDFYAYEQLAAHEQNSRMNRLYTSRADRLAEETNQLCAELGISPSMISMRL